MAESRAEQGLGERAAHYDPLNDQDRPEGDKYLGALISSRYFVHTEYAPSDEPATKRRKTAKVKLEIAASTEGTGKRPGNSSKGKKMGSAAKGKGRSRVQGSLVGLLNMPIDVFYEISRYLASEYVVALAHLNWHFRTTLMAPAANFVWKAARQNVPGIPTPDPPSGVTELVWAYLLFTPQKACFECGQWGTSYVDFAFRRRLCLGCRRKHLFRCTGREKSWFDQELLALVPYTNTGGNFGAGKNAPQNIKAGKPDAREEYDDFKQARGVAVKNIMEIVEGLEAWFQTKEKEQLVLETSIDNEKREQRYNTIVNRLLAAGYDRSEIIPRELYPRDLQVDSSRPLTEAAWVKMRPRLVGQLDAARAKRTRLLRQCTITTAYNLFLETLLPIQRLFLPRELFPTDYGSVAPELPHIQTLIDAPGTDNLSQAQLDTLLALFLADTSAWSLDHLRAIAKAASLVLPFPPALGWVTWETPFADRVRRLGELGTIFDLAIVVFVVDTWKSGGSVYHMNWNRNVNWMWTVSTSSLFGHLADPLSFGHTPQLPNEKIVFIGRDAMNMRKPDDSIMVFSERGSKAVRGLLTLEGLDPASTTAAQLDARNSLFKCGHCRKNNAAYTWRGCVVHFLLSPLHTEPSWSLIPTADVAFFAPRPGADRFPSRTEKHNKWMCNHCPVWMCGDCATGRRVDTYAHVVENVSQSHGVVSPQEEVDFVYLPSFEQCAPRLLVVSRSV
ncbi:hypothetical protein B0H19DRAFT_1273386 [Mycena capillaripes]|nr:hypothetical protein B0H19DRAFT_1273386 [Mycena capillaripes]